MNELFPKSAQDMLQGSGCVTFCEERVGSPVRPMTVDSHSRVQMQYELTPGGYYWSKEFSTAVFGLRLLDPPRALAELLEEVNHASPKQVAFFDSRSFLGGDLPYAVNWTDAAANPSIIPIFLNPKRATPELVAHELMHSWIDFFPGLEDHRRYVDQSDKPMATMVNIIQSMVLDCTVLWQLRKRSGFDCDQFRRDIVAAAVESITPYKYGMVHATAFGQLVGAEALAVPLALPDFYDLDKKDKGIVQELWKICRHEDPAMAWVVEKFVRALRTHGYEAKDGIRRATDDCLFAAFDFLGMRFDPDRHLMPFPHRVRTLDKMPDFMRGAAVAAKFDALYLSIEHRRHVLWRQVSANEYHFMLAPEGSAYSSLDLPRIVRPKEAGPLQFTNMFPLGLSEQEMSELPKRVALKKPWGSLPAPDAYRKSYGFSNTLAERRTNSCSMIQR